MRKLQNIDVFILDDFLTIGIDRRGQENQDHIGPRRQTADHHRLPDNRRLLGEETTRPRRIRLTGQQTQCRTGHRTWRLRHAPTPGKRHTWRQRVVDRIRGPAAGPDKASCPALPPSRNPALPPFRNTPTNKPLSTNCVSAE